MQLEDWTELIKNVLGPSAFKTVGAAALHALYLRPVVVTDGTGDGGVDAWIEISAAPAGRVPVQFHSGRAVEWYDKLREDLGKPAVRDAPARRLFFVCAQTPTEDAVRRRKAEFERSHGIAVEVIDARAIASLALSDATVLAPLRSYLPAVPIGEASRLPSVAEGTQLAFVFFHEESAEFREEIARSALTTSLVRSREPLEVEEVLDRALSVFGGERHLRRMFRRQLTALVDGGAAILREGRLSPSADLVRRVEGESTAGILAETKLRDDCAAALEGRVHADARRREAVDAVFDDLGLLLRRSVVERLPGGEREALIRRFNALERRLQQMLKPAGGTVHDALRAIIDVAAASVYGRALASAELFIQMTKHQAGDFSRALTGRDRVEVVLDTSVAMPMLCANFDRVADGWVTSEVALELYELLRARDMKMVVPNLYVEEMAAHLVSAARDYAALAGEVGLARSENFFVAHYHSVAASRNEPATSPGFEEFLSDLGLPTSWARDDFFVVRARVQRKLTQLLQRYGIDIGWVSYTDALPLSNEPARPPTVLDHDRRVVAWLDARTRSSSEGLVLCSQDRWLLSAVAEVEWLAVDPAALADLLPMVRPTGTVTPLVSLRELAAQVNEDAMERSAKVWDLLASIEGPRFADRDLLRRAREFKDAWIARTRAVDRPAAAEWQRFKERLAIDG